MGILAMQSALLGTEIEDTIADFLLAGVFVSDSIKDPARDEFFDGFPAVVALRGFIAHGVLLDVPETDFGKRMDRI